MLFNSLTFVVFFAVVLAVYWALSSWSARKTVLLIASYVFYGAWNPPFVLLLVVSTVIDFVAALQMATAKTKRSRVFWLILSLVSNLGMLAFFKYGNFLLENFQLLVAQFGIQYQPAKMGIVLPVGISFYTFQTLSYTIDVYRGQLKPTRSLRDFSFFVAFFPQLVAGPIVRAADFLPQCLVAPKPHAGRLGWGLFLMTLGLFQKIVLADALLSRSVESVFSYPGPLAGLDAWIGVLAFSGQIFFDFAGYSTCAIGAALCLGFYLGDNFKFPYAAIGFSDFWRRWHISLSTFLRDYLYIPLGGGRNGAGRAALNLIVVMFLGGLWHGAAWTFVIWGIVHGVFLVIERTLRHAFKDAVWTDALIVKIGLSLVTYAGVCFAWVFFRASDFKSALQLLQAMVGGNARGDAILPTGDMLQVVAVTVALLVAHWRLRDTSIEESALRQPRWLVTASWAVMVGAIILTQGNGNAFIYFQF